MTEFLMPSLGADMEDGTLVEWRKKIGDTVKRGDIIAEVETQKGLIEIELFDEGVIEKLLIKEGEKVPVGTPMALINPDGAGVETKKVTASKKKEVELHPIEEKAEPQVMEKLTKDIRIKATPIAKKIAEDKGIDLSQITGSGEKGAITKDDVENAIVQKGEISKTEKGEKPVEKLVEVEPEKTGTQPSEAELYKKEKQPVEVKKERSVNPAEVIRSAVAAAMSKSNREIPHYYLEKRIDMSKALAWMKETNRERPIQKRLLPAALFIKAVASSLDEVPELNAIWENGLQLKNEINIGFVISLRTGGIIVPAILQADAKSVDEIMDALNDVIPRARALKLRSSELSDSTITITNIGEGSADKVFGVIYPPQVAIVGFGNITEQAFAENGMLGIRPVVDVTLAGDHRATDGITGSRFLASLNKYLQNPESL
jgi:pyruvate dehydrogenase E2 component (dihydrolipoamide acetyltransferase)